MNASSATVLRIGTNALYRLAEHNIVVRIGLSPHAATTAEKEIRVARWLQSNGVHSARPVRSIAQPISVDGFPVTFWDWIAIDADPPTSRDLGNALRRLHRLSGDDIDLPCLDPLEPARARLAIGNGEEDASLGFLRAECDRLDDAYGELEFELTAGPIHGDAHVENLAKSGGQTALIDLETFATGPREWDLTPTAVRHERFGLPRDQYLEFSRAYGFELTGWPGFPVLRRMREVLVTTWLLGPASLDRRARSELTKRLAALRDGRLKTVWEPL